MGIVTVKDKTQQKSWYFITIALKSQKLETFVEEIKEM